MIPTYILLGKFGDLILMLPAWKEIHRRAGGKTRVNVVVSKQYESVLEGCNYINPHIVPHHWSQGAVKARTEVHAQQVITPHWWNARDMSDDIPKGDFGLDCQGLRWMIDRGEWPDYMTSMYARCGFTRAEMMFLPLEFDNRSLNRETNLINFLNPKPPFILYNLSGNPSPPHARELESHLLRMKEFTFVSLAKIKAHRIYDLLGLMDAAEGIITCDTSTLHLAHGTKTPYIALTKNEWAGSVPRGNCVLEVKYDQIEKRLVEIMETVRFWKNECCPY